MVEVRERWWKPTPSWRPHGRRGRSPDTTAAPVAPAHCSAAAQDKAARQRTPDQLPVQSFRDLLRHLATMVQNRIEPTLKSIPPFDMITRPDALQQHALQLLQLSPRLLAT